MARISLVILILLISPLGLSAQSSNIGIPPIRNFLKKTYRAGTQNWDIGQDSRGVLYFANNEGLLEFDGVSWTCLPIRNKTIVRSLAIDPSGKIYVGGQSEIGYFFPNPQGRLEYHSLIDYVPEENRNFEDVWDISLFNGAVFFRTNAIVFRWADQKITVFDLAGELSFMGTVGNKLVVQLNYNSLLRFRNDHFEPWHSSSILHSPVSGLIPTAGDTVLITTLKDGIFFVTEKTIGQRQTQYDNFLKNNRVYCTKILSEGMLALGTSMGGLLILDRHGHAIRHLNTDSGLQTNNILSLFADRSGGLWLGLNTGIDYISINSPISLIYPDGNQEGTGYAVQMANDMLYCGTSNGLYVTPWKSYYDPLQPDYFDKVAGTDGQVWGLCYEGGEVLMGHHEGAFRIEGKQAVKIYSMPGAWRFISIGKDYLLGGTYSGLVLYKKVNGHWQYQQHLNGLDESCRILIQDDQGLIWVSHPYRGIYKINLKLPDPEISVRFYTSKDGLPTDLFNYVFKLDGKPVFAAEYGIYKYDPSADRFEPSEAFNTRLGSHRRIKLLKESPSGDIWYVADDEVGILKISGAGLERTIQRKVIPALADKLVGGFECIYPLDDHNVFIGAEKGFLHFDPTKADRMEAPPQVILTGVSLTAPSDSSLFCGYFMNKGSVVKEQSANDFPVLSHRQNGLHFSFAATNFDEPELMEFQVFLEGIDPDWSSWNPKPERDYTNLSPGWYKFKVRARSHPGSESQIVEYTFRISPPWYANSIAYSFYLLGILTFIGSVIYVQRRRFESEKAALTSAHQRKEEQHRQLVEKSEAEIERLQNERLKVEIDHKNKELASATMHLVQKGEMLQTIQEALSQILDKARNPEVGREIRKLLQLLESDDKLDKDWEQFALHFDQVHIDFLHRLRDRFPQLSPNDYKLCAYLRMNLSTKEIAPLLNISVRGVEASRYRLRKKLDLPNDANLVDFMMEV